MTNPNENNPFPDDGSIMSRIRDALADYAGVGIMIVFATWVMMA